LLRLLGIYSAMTPCVSFINNPVHSFGLKCYKQTTFKSLDVVDYSLKYMTVGVRRGYSHHLTSLFDVYDFQAHRFIKDGVEEAIYEYDR
jgi:hypothetical protein